MNIKQILATTAALSTLAMAQPIFAADASVATVNGKPIKQSWVDYITRDAEARGQETQ